MRTTLVSLAFMLLPFISIIANSGGVKGKVVDAETGEALIGATVLVSGTTTGTITDYDGNFVLNGLEPGSYNIVISYVSYESQEFQDIEVEPNLLISLDASLGVASAMLEEVVVVGKTTQRTETALQVLQKKSASVMDGISAQQIGRLGDSDAAKALRRVTGVNVQGGKYIFVRGLSDRYSKITLNGAEVPGLDPNRNTVQMDMFPSSIIENIVVRKTFTPDLPGDFVGGHIDVITRDFPDQFSFSFSAGASYNTQASFNDEFYSYKGGNTDWLGFDDGKRDIPSAAKLYELPNEPYNPDVKPNLVAGASSFNKDMNYTFKNVNLEKSFSAALGNQVELFNKPLGFNVSASYKYSHFQYTDGGRIRYRGLNGDQLMESKIMSDNKGEEEVLWSAFGTLSYKLSPNNKIAVNILRNQSGLSYANYSHGPEPDESRDIEERILGYLQRSLTSYQVNGKHVLPGLNKASIDWKLSYTDSRQYEPDLRFFYNDVNEISEDSTNYTVRPNKQSARFYRDMQESNFVQKFNFSLPFSMWSNPAKFQTGAAFVQKNRNSDDNQFLIEQQGSIVFNGDPADFLSDDNMIAEDKNYLYWYMVSTDLTNAVNSYKAEETTRAAYAMFDLPLTGKIRAVFGLRYEYSNLFVENKVDTTGEDISELEKLKYKTGSYEEHDFLPSINFKYTVKENMNLRLAYAKTLARPAFREVAPYAAWDPSATARQVGNPNLKRDLIHNYDFRWEWFFKRGEMLALSAFYKDFAQPIEKYDAESAKNAEINIRNNFNGSHLYGIEAEVRKKLDFIPGMQDFMIGANVSFIHSETDQDSARYAAAIIIDSSFSSTRQMFEQSPYIINAYMMYENEIHGLSANLAFNMAGKKIILLSKGAMPDVYELPYPTLDFNVSKRLGSKFYVKLSVKNIFDSELKRTYDLKGNEFIYDRYKKGRDFGLSLSYKF